MFMQHICISVKARTARGLTHGLCVRGIGKSFPVWPGRWGEVLQNSLRYQGEMRTYVLLVWSNLLVAT